MSRTSRATASKPPVGTAASLDLSALRTELGSTPPASSLRPWRTSSNDVLERVRGIEPLYEAWEAAVLPLNYTRDPARSLASGIGRCAFEGAIDTVCDGRAADPRITRDCRFARAPAAQLRR